MKKTKTENQDTPIFAKPTRADDPEGRAYSFSRAVHKSTKLEETLKQFRKSLKGKPGNLNQIRSYLQKEHDYCGQRLQRAKKALEAVVQLAPARGAAGPKQKPKDKSR